MQGTFRNEQKKMSLKVQEKSVGQGSNQAYPKYTAPE
jgi:hypothetical protein